MEGLNALERCVNVPSHTVGLNCFFFAWFALKGPFSPVSEQLTVWRLTLIPSTFCDHGKMVRRWFAAHYWGERGSSRVRGVLAVGFNASPAHCHHVGARVPLLWRPWLRLHAANVNVTCCLEEKRFCSSTLFFAYMAAVKCIHLNAYKAL